MARQGYVREVELTIQGDKVRVAKSPEGARIIIVQFEKTASQRITVLKMPRDTSVLVVDEAREPRQYKFPHTDKGLLHL